MTLARDIGITLPTDPTYWERAEFDYSQAANEVERLMIVEHGDRADLAAAREAIRHREAALSLGTLTKPDGTPCKNADERTAVLLLRCAMDLEHKTATAELRRAETRAAQTTAALERARDSRSLAKRRLDYAIARLHYVSE